MTLGTVEGKVDVTLGTVHGKMDVTLGTGVEYLLKVHHHYLTSHDDGDGAVGNRGLESPQVHDGFFVG